VLFEILNELQDNRYATGLSDLKNNSKKFAFSTKTPEDVTPAGVKRFEKL